MNTFFSKSWRPVLGLLTAAVLSACGGGDDDEAPFVPSAELLATKRSDYTVPLLDSTQQYFTSGKCAQVTPPTTVFEQEHTVTYAAEGVPENDQARVAEAAERAVKSIRTRGDFTAAVGYTGEKIRVCVDTNAAVGRGNGSAGYNTVFVAQSAHNMDQLVYHELTHTAQYAVLGCLIGGASVDLGGGLITWIPNGERWLFEGMALRFANQDVASSGAVRGAFSGSTPTPIDVVNNTDFPNTAQYPGYRLAVDTLITRLAGGDENKLWDFLRDYEARRDPTYYGVPLCKRYDQAAWDASFEHVFGMPLRDGADSFKAKFWSMVVR